MPVPVTGGAASLGSTPPVDLPAPPAGMHGGPGPLLRVVKDQRLAFLLVGGFNTGLGTFWFVVIHVATGGWGGELTTLGIAHVLSVPCAFLAYRHLVFRVRGHVLGDLARYEVVQLPLLAVNAVLLPVFVRLVHLPAIPGQLLSTVVIAVASYLGLSRFTFRRARTQQPAEPTQPAPTAQPTLEDPS